MSKLTKILKQVAVFRDSNGNLVEGNLDASAVIGSGGITAAQHMDDVARHLSETERGYLTAAGAANGVALLDASGHLPSGVFDSTKMPVETTVADIAARDALTGLPDGYKVFVTDASGDAAVDSGWAIYRYHVAVGEESAGWTKVAEGESLDIIHDWANIQNRPVTDEELLDAVAKKHAHGNSAVLTLLTATEAGKLQYNGADVGNTLLASKMVTEVPDVWPADVRTDGILFLVDVI